MAAIEKPLNCTIKNPVNLHIGDIKMDVLFGCKVIDITFPNIMNPEVGEIRFKNYYVAQLTIKAKFRSDQTPSEVNSPGDQPKWRMCLKRMKLMPDPHCELGSHNFFSLTGKQFRCDLKNITALRLILQQPSPVWREFKLEDLKLFRSAGQGPKSSPLPSWLLEEPKDRFKKKTVEGVPDLEALSASLQQLWALAEEAASRPMPQALGRFEVDGCYDINLLAYT